MEGRVALVIGGNSGIGRATAEEFVRRGALVVIAGRRVELGQEVAAAMTAAGGKAAFVPVDVSSEESVEQLVARTAGTFGGLDYAFNTAGDSPRSMTRMHHEYRSEERRVGKECRL